MNNRYIRYPQIVPNIFRKRYCYGCVEKFQRTFFKLSSVILEEKLVDGSLFSYKIDDPLDNPHIFKCKTCDLCAKDAQNETSTNTTITQSDIMFKEKSSNNLDQPDSKYEQSKCFSATTKQSYETKFDLSEKVPQGINAVNQSKSDSKQNTINDIHNSSNSVDSCKCSINADCDHVKSNIKKSEKHISVDKSFHSNELNEFSDSSTQKSTGSSSRSPVNSRKAKKCNNINCGKHPSFNYPNETRGIYCGKHKLDGMINVTSQKCIYDNCKSSRFFNYPLMKPLYCSKHRLDGMINVKQSCYSISCDERPTCNYPNEKKPLYCEYHKLSGMIDIVTKFCEHPRCIQHTTASFNYPNEKKPIYCAKHKKHNMVSFYGKLCKASKCKSDALYGYENCRAFFCETHKESGMIDLKTKYKCSVENCNKNGNYSLNNIKYCINHMPYEKNKTKCKYCDIDDTIDTVCESCNNIRSKKELTVVKFLREKIKIPFEHNTSRMLNGCSKKRPDIYYDMPMHSVIVEVDENQHAGYDESCEYSRINEIVNGIGGKPVIIIRFNPDKIMNQSYEVKYTFKERLDKLESIIKLHIKTPPDHFCVKLIKMFYDDDYFDYMEIKEEDITSKVCI